MTTIVPSGGVDEGDLDTLQTRLAELEGQRRQRAAELAGVEADLVAFEIRYRHEVGFLHEELDDLERLIAEAESGVHPTGKGRPTERTEGPPTIRTEIPQPRYTSDAVRKLFRDVAKAIHPDLATDAGTRDRRHTLMVEANLAYSLGDEERLRLILQSWERSPEAVLGTDPVAVRLRVVRRIEEIQEQLKLAAQDLETLTGSPMWKLKTMVDAAAERGRDLVRDMVDRLKRDIMVARNRLDAITWSPDA